MSSFIVVSFAKACYGAIKEQGTEDNATQNLLFLGS